MTTQWQLARLWYGVGVAMILAVMVGSLLNFSQPLPLENVDKLHHLVAYALLMYWWGMVQPRRRWQWALFLVGMGIALEFLQSMTPYRTLDTRDMMFNTAGVALAGLLLASGADQLLPWLDQRLGDRLHARSS